MVLGLPAGPQGLIKQDLGLPCVQQGQRECGGSVAAWGLASVSLSLPCGDLIFFRAVNLVAPDPSWAWLGRGTQGSWGKISPGNNSLDKQMRLREEGAEPCRRLSLAGERRGAVLSSCSGRAGGSVFCGFAPIYSPMGRGWACRWGCRGPVHTRPSWDGD